MLNGGSARAFADLRQQLLALQPVIAEDPDFDEFVGIEATLDFGHDGVGQARAADDHDRMEHVSTRPEGAAIGADELFHRLHCR